jgi:predicted GIY-YIG superfamily endonuclease
VACEKRFVYILSNRSAPNRYYTGVTSDVTARLAAHNGGQCTHTAGGRPWAIDVVVEFTDEGRALAFERYLKSGSGVAFAMRHLRSKPEKGWVSARKRSRRDCTARAPWFAGR